MAVQEKRITEYVTEYYGGGEHPKDSNTTLYRYRLDRIWDSAKKPLLVIGCNPSTATAEKLDPTMLKVMEIARDNGYGGVIMCNLYSYRETNPNEMKKAARKHGFDYIIGRQNETVLMQAAEKYGFRGADDVVFAYGNIGVTGWKDINGKGVNDEALQHAIELMVRIRSEKSKNVWAFALTDKGQPRHPLKIKNNMKANWINLIDYYLLDNICPEVPPIDQDADDDDDNDDEDGDINMD